MLVVEYLLTASPDFFDGGTKNERDERLKNGAKLKLSS